MVLITYEARLHTVISTDLCIQDSSIRPLPGQHPFILWWWTYKRPSCSCSSKALQTSVGNTGHSAMVGKRTTQHKPGAAEVIYCQDNTIENIYLGYVRKWTVVLYKRPCSSGWAWKWNIAESCNVSAWELGHSTKSPPSVAAPPKECGRNIIHLSATKIFIHTYIYSYICLSTEASYICPCHIMSPLHVRQNDKEGFEKSLKVLSGMRIMRDALISVTREKKRNSNISRKKKKNP